MKTTSNHDGDRATWQDDLQHEEWVEQVESHIDRKTPLSAAGGVGRFLVAMSIILAGGACMFADPIIGVCVMLAGLYWIAVRAAK